MTVPRVSPDILKLYKVLNEQAHILAHPYNIALYTHSNGIVIDQCSGTLVNIGDRKLIATCAHFLSDNQNREIKTAFTDKYSVDPGYSSRIVFFSKHGARDPIHSDIGYIELRNDIPTDIEFLSEDRFEIDPDYVFRDVLLQSGYPCDKIIGSGYNRAAFNPIYVLTEMSSTKHAHRKIRKGKHVLSDYPTLSCAIMPEGETSLPRLNGMSGGGLWSTGFSRHQNLWTSDHLKLAGINVEFSDHDIALPVIGVSINEIVKLFHATKGFLDTGKTVCRVDNRKVIVYNL